MVNWKLFIGAGILTSGLLLKAGAPVTAVAMGLVAAAWLTRRTRRRVR